MFYRNSDPELLNSSAFGVARSVGKSTADVVQSSSGHRAGCSCPACTAVHPAGCACSACVGMHSAGCVCGACRRSTALSSTAEAETSSDVPPEVEAMDGVQSEEEAHNVERPARKSLKKKGPKGKPLSEFSVGETVTAKVKSLTNYGAFMDIGAETDGLLHISQLSVDYVKDVNDILKPGQEMDVRIVKIDEAKSQVALSLLSEQEEEEAKEAAAKPRQQRQRSERTSGRRDDRAVVNQLKEKGWSPEQFVEGSVASTVDFGAFVRVDVSQLNSECEGDMDGLVHISALTAGRADSVTGIVNVGDKVQVRVKSIADNKVSLTMVSVEDEAAKAEASAAFRGGGGQTEGAKDWKESLEKLQGNLPEFKNSPLVVDLRK